MGIVESLLAAMDPERKRLEERNQELELECVALRQELESIGRDDAARLQIRVRSLEAALGRLLRIRERDYSGADEQAELRAIRAILEDHT